MENSSVLAGLRQRVALQGAYSPATVKRASGREPQSLKSIEQTSKTNSWANYYWPIITRFKWFNRRRFDEFLEAQDDHKNRLKPP